MSANIPNSTNPHALSHTRKPPSPSFSAPTSRSPDLIYRRILRSGNAIDGSSLKLSISQSCIHTTPKIRPLRRSCNASHNSDAIGDGHLEDLDQELSLPIGSDTTVVDAGKNSVDGSSRTKFGVSDMELLEPSILGIRPEPPNWTARDEIIKDMVARKANSIEMPLSLRMLKLKRSKELHQPTGLRRELNSTEKAFGSAIYIIKEIQRQALYLRGEVLGKDLDSTVKKVQRDMNSSFVLLFREVFSCTPVLMADTMVLMADFATYSMRNHVAGYHQAHSKLRMKLKREEESVASSTVQALACEGEAQEDTKEKEAALWNAMVEEASRMQREMRGDVLDKETVVRFVAPVKAEMEADDYVEYDRTHLLYRIALSEQPDSPLLLSNYAQFLFLVVGDHDRAEECFQRALRLDSQDAEVLSLYATFLWIVRKDLWGAEERYIQAVAAAAPGNAAHYSSIYASFLWGTGGEGTCFPLQS